MRQIVPSLEGKWLRVTARWSETPVKPLVHGVHFTRGCIGETKTSMAVLAVIASEKPAQGLARPAQGQISQLQ